MSQVSHNKKQCDLRWDNFPAEIRGLIFKVLAQEGCSFSRLATVSKEWQAELEPYNFARIRLTPSRINDFGSMIHRSRALVGYIWFCLELDNYDCTRCAPSYETFTDDEGFEAISVQDTAHCPITTSFKKSFSILSGWEVNGDLTPDISIYSLSDSEHWFKYLTFVPDTPGGDEMEQTIANQPHDDPEHGWIAGFRRTAPPRYTFHKMFHSVMEEGPFMSEKLEMEWWDQLPSVPAVTSLLLQQQNRRRWRPCQLAHMFTRLPRLEEVHYEPWREWGSVYLQTDRREWFLCTSHVTTCSHL